MKKVVFTKAGNENADLKILPCKIDFSGTANIEKFVPIDEIGSLYGRKINGFNVNIPEEYLGNVVEVNEEHTHKELKATHEFNRIQY